MLSAEEVASAAVGLLDSKRLVLALPRWRGVVARAASIGGRPAAPRIGAAAQAGGAQALAGLGFAHDRNPGPTCHEDRSREPGDGTDRGERRRRGARAHPGAGRAGARSAARLGGARLRGPRSDPAALPEVGDRQLRPHHRDDHLRDRQGLGGRADGRGRLCRGRVRVLGQERRGLPRRRARAHRLAVRQGPQAGAAPRAGRRGRRDRPLELPADQLVRRLHPGARGRQRGDPQAERGHAADGAADGRVRARVRHAGGRLPGRAGVRRHRRRPHRRGRLPDVHGLHGDRQEGDGARRADAHADRARDGRQGPDAGAGRRRPGARGQRGRPLLDAERRADLHLDRARVRGGAGLRRVRVDGDRDASARCARARRTAAAASTSAR